MKRSIWIYGGLLVVLLALSYLRWTGALGSDQEQGDVIIMHAVETEIEKVAYHDEKQDVALEWKTDDLGAYAWVRHEQRTKLKKPSKKSSSQETPGGPEQDSSGEEPSGKDSELDKDSEGESAEQPGALQPGESPPEQAEDAASKPEEPEEEFEIKVENSSFKGGKAADELRQSLAPFKAIRKLQNPSPEKAQELGLAEPEAWIQVTRKGRTYRFELGGEAYGTKDRYLHDIENNQYYLVDADTLRPLRYARSRLPDRSLTSLEEADIQKVRLEGSSGSTDMVQQNRQDKDAAFWANPSDTTRPMEIYANWLDKVLRLKGLSYVKDDEQPQDLALAFKVRLYPESGKEETIEVFTSKGENGEARYFARSNFSRGLVKLHKVLAEEATQDVPDVIEARSDEDDEDEQGEQTPAMLE